MGLVKDITELIKVLSEKKIFILCIVTFFLGIFVGLAFPKWPMPDNIKEFIGRLFEHESMANLYDSPTQPKITTIPGTEGFDNKICNTYTQFNENKQEWPFRSYKEPDEDGFYCARESSEFLTPPIWYGKLIPADFEVIEISAQILNQDDDTINSPPFVIFLGNNPPIWVLYMFENNFQLVGFEKRFFTTTSDELNQLEREVPGRVLSMPLQYGTQVDIVIKLLSRQGNEATFSFDFSYISSRDGKATNETLNYNVLLPFPNPATAETKFGFGTSNTACVKPIRFMVCGIEE